jgi:tRNA-specific 2-thiouridylase
MLPRKLMTMSRVIVAMSGGLDSSVAAALLKEEGHEVIGVTMKIWDGELFSEQGFGRGCYGPDKKDIDEARTIAQTLDIPFHVFDLRQEFKAEVLDYVRHEYTSGRTPNPCIRCNRRVKLGILVEKAQESGIAFDYVATGHYVRIGWDENKHRHLLKRAMDLQKDQSYFLFSLSQEQLGRTLFPLGNYSKLEVRRIASGIGIGVNDKPESQDFVQGGYYSLLGGAAQLGPIFDRNQNVLGEHRGIPFYTIGQRKGLGLSAREALYVTSIDPERNAIQVGHKEDIYSNELTCSGLNWISIRGLEDPITVKAKIRYSHTEADAIVTPIAGDKAHVRFRKPQMAITPGQAVVFYDRNVVVGGGIIERHQGSSLAKMLAV